ncbi:LlaJI family restriction endonuclease [Clostridium subterminale]|uniref:LlaJI family restriction endonuclease n=1 Tax=Clostridium subterminale TaxID=1550 RepID=A0ABN1KXT5_CLOSU
MISKFVREQKRYTQKNLIDIFECPAEKAVNIIKKMKEYGVLKAIKANDAQKSMSDLIDKDIVVADVEVGESEYLYVFTFVGVITVYGRILKCYPKYITSEISPKSELKQILKVLEKYNAKEQIIRMYNDSEESGSFNLLAVMIYLMHDYYENGIYINTQDIIEINGSGDILWDKTINETFTLICNNRPYYTELLTKKRVTDDFDYFKRLHECILSQFTKELKKADLLDLFDIMPVELSDETLDDFGDNEYILYRIQNELNIQFNTRKQLVLKTIYAYASHRSNLSAVDGFSMFGTNSYNLVWERVCAEVMNNQLQNTLGSLSLPKSLHKIYNENATLISLIEKPKWVGIRNDRSLYTKIASDTLIPDLITIYSKDGMCHFVIFDTKYYMLQLEPDKELRGQPGIGDVTKQYLYQLAYKNFIDHHSITSVKNCFLMPTDQPDIIDKGYVSMEILEALELQPIKIRKLPATMMYDYFLKNEKMNIDLLKL